MKLLFFCIITELLLGISKHKLKCLRVRCLYNGDLGLTEKGQGERKAKYGAADLTVHCEISHLRVA